MTDDYDLLTEECKVLRDRISRAPSVTEEGILRDKILALQIQNETDRREMDMKFRRQREEFDEEKQRHNEEKRALMKRSQSTGRSEEIWEERLRLIYYCDLILHESDFIFPLYHRSKCSTYEDIVKSLTEKNDILQKVLEDKEDEFEVRLKAKVVEWKSEWDLAQKSLKDQITSLQKEVGFKKQSKIPYP